MGGREWGGGLREGRKQVKGGGTQAGTTQVREHLLTAGAERELLTPCFCVFIVFSPLCAATRGVRPGLPAKNLPDAATLHR